MSVLLLQHENIIKICQKKRKKTRKQNPPGLLFPGSRNMHKVTPTVGTGALAELDWWAGGGYHLSGQLLLSMVSGIGRPQRSEPWVQKTREDRQTF